MKNRPLALAAVALTLALAACSTPAPTAPVTSPPAPTSAASTMVSTPTSTSPPTPSAVPSGPPVEVKELAAESGKLTMALYPLRRDGNLMWLTARVTVIGGNQFFKNYWAGSNLDSFPSGWRIVDQANKKAYLPARANSSLMCGPRVPMLYPGDEMIITCAFGAVPESLTTVTVQSASFGEYANVPIR